MFAHRNIKLYQLYFNIQVNRPHLFFFFQITNLLMTATVFLKWHLLKNNNDLHSKQERSLRKLRSADYRRQQGKSRHIERSEVQHRQLGK